METKAQVPPVQTVTELSQYRSKPETTPAQDQLGRTASANAIADPIDFRLIIDKDPLSGAFVYRTVDRFTGETVTQFPSEEIVRLRDSAAYQAGSVFNGKV